MEEKNLNEKESLTLITQMIQNSKKNLRVGSGNMLLLWGYLSAITAILVYVFILMTANPAWNWLWFLIPAIGYPVMYWWKKKEEKPVLTYTDKVLGSIWKVTGSFGICASFLAGIYFQNMGFMLPLVLIICALGVSISGSIINDKWMYNCGGFVMAIGVAMLYHTMNPLGLDIQYPAFALCFIIMMIIPGHRLNREAKRKA